MMRQRIAGGSQLNLYSADRRSLYDTFTNIRTTDCTN